jgi:hypothetical protein
MKKNEVEWDEKMFRDNKADMKFEFKFSNGDLQERFVDIKFGKELMEKLNKGILTQVNIRETAEKDSYTDIGMAGEIIYLKHIQHIKYYWRKKNE